METVFHIRKRLRRRGGNQFYRDTAIRETSTFCGAPVTGYDFACNSKPQPWTNGDTDFIPCPECVRLCRLEAAKK